MSWWVLFVGVAYGVALFTTLAALAAGVGEFSDRLRLLLRQVSSYNLYVFLGPSVIRAALLIAIWLGLEFALRVQAFEVQPGGPALPGRAEWLIAIIVMADFASAGAQFGRLLKHRLERG